jgi:tetratricopeptide (TPR) repeat protein
LTDHADRLDERHHHRQLENGVQLALDLSYQHLPGDQQRLLRLAALHPGQDLDAYAAAALTGTDPPTAATMLGHLCRDHLLQQATPGRYSFHDLVRAYATGRAGDEDPPLQRRTALTRLFDYYLATTAAAIDVAYPHERHRHPTVMPTGAPTPDLAEQKHADLWLDTELANLLAAAQHAAEHGWPEHTWQLTALLDRHLLIRGHYRDAETLHQHALHLARHHGNRPAEMNALNGLGQVHLRLGRHEQVGDYYRRALQIAQDIGHRLSELAALTGLGYLYRTQGRHEQAGDYYRRALQIAQDIGDRLGELNALNGLGYVHRMLGRHSEAASCYQRVFDLARALGSRNWQYEALQGLGRAHHATGHPDLALTYHEQALQHATDLAQRGDQARAHDGLAHAHHAMGGHEHARQQWQHALDILTSLGTDHTEDIEASVPNIRAHLTNLSQQPPTAMD